MVDFKDRPKSGFSSYIFPRLEFRDELFEAEFWRIFEMNLPRGDPAEDCQDFLQRNFGTVFDIFV